MKASLTPRAVANLPHQYISGDCGHISYFSLVQALKKAGIVKPNEEVIELSFDNDGITFSVEEKK